MVIRKSLLSLSIASVLALTACGSDNDKKPTPEPPIPPPVVVVPETPEKIEFLVNGNIIDSASFDVVTAEVSFLENGEAATNLLDVNGNVLTSISAADFSFAVKADATVTEVTAVVSAAGYFTKRFAINLDVADTVSVLPVQLALISKTGEGVSDVVETTTITGGTTADPIVVEPSAEDAGKVAEVTVPAGIELQDADGNVITGTEISLNVSSSDNAATLVPEGLTSADETKVATPVGTASVNMADENGNKIKKFSSPIEITVQVPESAGVTPGQELNLASYDEDTGTWSTETNKAVVGAFNATTKTSPAMFMTDHLTVFVANEEQVKCTVPTKVTYSGDDIPAAGLTITASASDLSAVSLSILAGDTQTTFNGVNVAADGTADFKVTDANGGVWFETTGENTPVCGEVAAALANPVQTVSEAFGLTFACSNSDDTGAIENALVKYGLEDKSTVGAVEATAGSYTLSNLIEGETYNVSVNSRLEGAAPASFTITADGTDEAGVINLTCDTTTGS
jgi:hypothetical protein